MRHYLAPLLSVLIIGCSGGKKSETKESAAKIGKDAAAENRAQPPRALKIGVTLHPYYSWTKNIVGSVPNVQVVPLLPGDVDAGNYQPAAEDIRKLADLDVVIENGIGHDSFLDEMVKASGNSVVVRIRINAQTPLLKSQSGDTSNSHTFISFTNAIQQTRYIEKRLSELRPEYAESFQASAESYVDRLRSLQFDTATNLAATKIERVVTVHDGYSYLLQEFGIELAGVVEPAHGLVPSAKELGDMIALIKREKISVVLSEESFPKQLLETLRNATGARVYLISHIATGDYVADKFEREMAENAKVLAQALVTDPK